MLSELLLNTIFRVIVRVNSKRNKGDVNCKIKNKFIIYEDLLSMKIYYDYLWRKYHIIYKKIELLKQSSSITGYKFGIYIYFYQNESKGRF